MWKRYTGSVCSGAIRGGCYPVCSAVTHGELKPGFINNGKAEMGHGNVRFVENVLNYLVHPDEGVVKWVPCSVGQSCPHYAVKAGGYPVVRAVVGGELKPGFLNGERAEMCHGNLRYLINTYDVLTCPPLDRVEMSNIRYNTSNAVINDLRFVCLESLSYRNNTSSNQNYTFQFNTTVTKSRTWNVTNGFSTTRGTRTTVNESSSVSFRFPVGSFNVSSSSAQVTTESVTKSTNAVIGRAVNTSKTVSRTFPVNIPANSTIRCKMEMKKMTVTVPYTARMVKIFKDGQRITKNVSGSFSGVDHNHVKFEADQS